MILFACDLDNTLIHSYKRADKNDICVEIKEGKELSFMTPKGYLALQKIAEQVDFVPVTTRSTEQYKRINLLKGAYPKYALTTNGGILLVNNEVDLNWLDESKKMIENTYGEMEKGFETLQKDPNISFEIRIVDEMFVFTKTKDVFKTTETLKSHLDESKVDILSHGEKIYIFPKAMNKGTAVKRLKKRLQREYLISAGDSEFDVPMLKMADLCIVTSKNFKEEFLKEHTNVLCEDKNNKFFTDELLHIVTDYIAHMK